MDTSIFPLPFTIHLAFACISFLVFLYQYTRNKRKYQMIMAIAIPATLLLYVNTSKTWFYIIAFAELAMMLVAIVFSFIEKRQMKTSSAGNTAENFSEKVGE